MKYKLQDGEELLMTLKPESKSAWYFLVSRCWHLLFFIVAWLLMDTVVSGNAGLVVRKITAALVAKIGWRGPDFLLLVLLLVIVIVVLFIFFRTVAASYTYVITNQRIMLSYGFFVLNHRMIPINQVNDLNMNATFFERLCGLGSVYIDTLGTLLGGGFNGAGGGMMSNRNSPANNTTRLECLTLAQCDEAMAVIANAIKKRAE